MPGPVKAFKPGIEKIAKIIQMMDFFKSTDRQGLPVFHRRLTYLSLALLLVLAGPTQARDKPEKIKDNSLVFEDKNFSGRINVCVKSTNVAEASVLLDYTLINCRSDKNAPLLLDINLSPGQPVSLVNFFPNPKGKWNYNYNYNWAVGHRGGKPNLNFPYTLPFEKDKTYKISQGVNGKITHHFDYNRYAIDFKMPVGTTICSARPGRVIAIKYDSNIHGFGEEFVKAANYVIIKHSDGSYGLYYHLKQNGVITSLGSMVQTGQPIAYSGNTGWTNGPHLHFGVASLILKGKEFSWLSHPARFITDQGIQLNLKENVFYKHPVENKRTSLSAGPSIH